MRSRAISGVALVAMTALVAWLTSCVGDDPSPDNGGPTSGPDGSTPTDDSGPQGGDSATNPNCLNANGTCGAGCNALNDDDCKPVCGNNVTEPGELCDDGNTDNGDACDPTCQFANKVSLLSGKPGAHASADDTAGVARFNDPQAITTDGTDLYVADRLDETIKKISVTGVVTTIAGAHGQKGSVNGTGTAARFDNPDGIAYVNGALYVSELTTMRKVDLATMAVTTPLPTTSPIYSGAGGTGARIRNDGTNVLYLQGGNIGGYNPANGSLSTIATSANVTGVSGGATALSVVHHPGSAGTTYWVGTSRNIVKCPGAGGNCTLVAGNTATAGCVDGVNTSTARMSSVTGQAVTATGNYFFFEQDCKAVRSIAATVTLTQAGSLTVPGYVDGAGGAAGPARFDGIASMAAIAEAGYLVETSPSDAQGTIRRVIGTVSGGVTVSTFAGAGYSTATDLVYAPKGSDVRYSTQAAYQRRVSSIAMDDTYVYGIAGFGPATLFRVSLATGGAEKVGDWTPSSYPSSGIVRMGSALYGGYGGTGAPECTIRKIGTDGQNEAKYAGTVNVCSGINSIAGTDGPRDSAVLNPRAMATDGTNVYFLDFDKTIRMVDAADDMVKTIAGKANAAPNVKDGVGALAELGQTAGLTYAAGSLYLADDSGRVIRRIELATKTVTTVAGKIGEAGAVDGVGGAARFAGVRQLASDGKSLFLLDTAGGYPQPNGSTIRQLELATGRVTTMIGTRGQWTIKDGVGTAARVSYPDLVVFDPKARLVVYDVSEGVFQRIQ